MKTTNIWLFVLLAPFFVAYLILFSVVFCHVLLLLFHRYQKLFSGALAWNPFSWNRDSAYDDYELELQKRIKRLMLLTFFCLFCLFVQIGIFMATGVIKPAPVAKRTLPTQPTLPKAPRVLAQPISHKNDKSNAVLK